MFDFNMDHINKILKQGAAARITDEDFIVREITRFKVSHRRQMMLNGENYFEGKHDILMRKRMVIGATGELEEIHNLPNNRIVDNQYKKMVIQKNNYLLGQPITVKCDNEAYEKILKKMVFNKKFQRLIKNVGKDSLNGAIGWVFPHYNEKGEFAFKRFRPFEIIPGWKDAEHTVLDYAIRIYPVIVFDGPDEKTVEKVEVYDEKGINFFELAGSDLVICEPYHQDYFTIENQGYNWSKIPLIPFKYNSEEVPLIKNVKSLQDGMNSILSNFQNNMEEDARNTILILVNYDGQNLGEFRKNLAAYGAVKVRSGDGANGDVKTLQIEVNAENYKLILEIFKKAIIENAMGYDAKDDRMGSNANQMNIQSMYNDIDLDANGMETEFQAAFEDLLWFFNMHLANMGMGDFENEEIEIIFNRDMLMNENEIITNVINSVGVLSDETILANHPWVDDIQAERDRKEKQQAKEEEQYANAFPGQVVTDSEGGGAIES